MNYKLCRNAMEVLVSEAIDRRIAGSDEFDPQDFERFDAIAYALNRLPALYATTEEGWTRQIARANRGLMDLVEMAVDWGINEAHRKRKPFDTPLRPETLENPAERALADLRCLLGRDDISWENMSLAVHNALQERFESDLAAAKTVPTTAPPVGIQRTGRKIVPRDRYTYEPSKRAS
ncbi:MAG: late competence development ComFB family protein [Geitlerinemataceae cyanobacterium]